MITWRQRMHTNERSEDKAESRDESRDHSADSETRKDMKTATKKQGENETPSTHGGG